MRRKSARHEASSILERFPHVDVTYPSLFLFSYCYYYHIDI